MSSKLNFMHNLTKSKRQRENDRYIAKQVIKKETNETK